VDWWLAWLGMALAWPWLGLGMALAGFGFGFGLVGWLVWLAGWQWS